MPRTPHPRLAAAVLGFGLLATACSSPGGGTPDTPEATAAADAADANRSVLQPSDDVREIEVLDVADGSITSLRDAADGDRPVLLWFWAPH